MADWCDSFEGRFLPEALCRRLFIGESQMFARMNDWQSQVDAFLHGLNRSLCAGSLIELYLQPLMVRLRCIMAPLSRADTLTRLAALVPRDIHVCQSVLPPGRASCRAPPLVQRTGKALDSGVGLF